jgi:hypothetical protein
MLLNLLNENSKLLLKVQLYKKIVNILPHFPFWIKLDQSLQSQFCSARLGHIGINRVPNPFGRKLPPSAIVKRKLASSAHKTRPSVTNNWYGSLGSPLKPKHYSSRKTMFLLLRSLNFFLLSD